MTDLEAKELAGMWDETASLFQKIPFSESCREIAMTYRDCANDLRLLVSGDKNVIERIKERKP